MCPTSPNRCWSVPYYFIQWACLSQLRWCCSLALWIFAVLVYMNFRIAKELNVIVLLDAFTTQKFGHEVSGSIPALSNISSKGHVVDGCLFIEIFILRVLLLTTWCNPARWVPKPILNQSMSPIEVKKTTKKVSFLIVCRPLVVTITWFNHQPLSRCFTNLVSRNFCSKFLAW